MHFYTAVASGLCCALLGVSSHAQTMYRCGSSYQDQPCQGAQSGAVVGSVGHASAPQGTTSAVAPTSQRCRQRGIEAEKIGWAKEGGKTLQQTLSDHTQSVSPALATDVYARRGSAAELRLAVEKDCTADEARSEEAARLNAAAAEILAGNAGSPAMDSKGASHAAAQNPTVGNSSESARGQVQLTSQSEQAEMARRDRCTALAGERTSIADQLRHGNDRSTLDRLNTRMSDLVAQQRSQGC